MLAKIRSSLSELTPLQILALLALIPLAIGIYHYELRWWILAILVPVILLGIHFLPSLAKGWTVVMTGLLLIVILVFGSTAVKYAYRAIIDPPEWDVRMLWLQGSVAARGENFYEPQYALKLAQPFQPTEEFISEIYFWYPPPSMFLFVGLGWFDIHTATLLWYIFLTAILVVDIVLLWQIFLKKEGLVGLLTTIALVVMLRAVAETLVYGQTNYLVLLGALLFWRNRQKAVGGIWLGIGILTKPLVAFLILFSILRRQWRSLAGTIGLLVIASLLAIPAFSPTTVFSYLTKNPTATAPGHLYTETDNQSLLGTILRVTGYDFTNTSPLRDPLFIVIGGVMLVISLWLVYRQDVVSDELAICLLLALCLLLYPSTGDHYSVLLLPSVFLVWSTRQRSLPETLAAAAFVALIYVLINLWTDYVFVAFVVDWLVLAGMGVWAIVRHKTVVATSSTVSQAVG